MIRTRFAAAAIVVLAGFSLAGCSKDEAGMIADAKARLEKRDAAGAEIELKNLLQKHPKSGEARFLLGQTMLRRGDAAGALIELERAFEARFDDNQVVPLLAQALAITGKTRRVIDEFADRKLSRPEAQAQLLATVASAHAREGDVPRATLAIEAALKAAPTAEVALLAQAKLAAAKGDAASAMAGVDTLLAQHPKSDEGWALKGDLLLRTPNGLAGATEAYRKALDAKPDQVHSRAALTALMMTQGDLTAAGKELEVLRKSAPKHFSTSFLDAQLATLQRDLPRARSIYQTMLKAAPDHPLLLASAAEVELRLNALAQAEALAAKAMSLTPNHVGARRVLAQTLLRKGQSAKAAVVLGPVAERPDAPPDILALAAQAQMMNGNSREAEVLYGRLARLKPTDPRLRTIVATSGFNKASPEAIIGELQAISADDSGITADLAIVNARMRAKQFDEALKAVEAIRKKQPDKALALQLKAQVLAMKNDVAGARQALTEALDKEPTYLPAVTALAGLDLAEKKPEAAKQRFKTLLERDPKNTSAMLALADLAQRTNAPSSEVVGHLQNAVDTNPQDATARLALIDHHVARGDLRAALAAAGAAVAALPDSVEMLDRQARIQLRMGEADQALSSFGKITTLQPKSVAGHLGQAQAHLGMNNFPQAQRALERVLERDPQHLEARVMQVSVLVGLKRWKEATDAARAMQAERRNEAVGYLLEAEVEGAQGRWDQAVPALKAAAAKPVTGGAQMRLHYALLKSGKAGEADAFAADWMKKHPKDVGMMFYLGDAAQAAGQKEQAERRYRDLLEIAPDHALAMNNLAMLLVIQKKPGALPLVDKALVLMPDSPPLLDTRAHALAANGQFDQAIEVQNRVVQLAPRSAQFRLALAQLYKDAGKARAARDELTKLADASLPMNDAQRQELRTMLASLQR